ncbi:MAG: tRNA (adenosine(37)-N6)-threonylcarbamoyltransferase complex transferase subunit TsaD, partial [Elusimicrobiota bacterium]
VPAKKKLPKKFVADLVASFQEAVVDTLVEKTMRAAAGLRLRRIVVGGGVAANSRLREKFASRGRKDKVKVYFPPMTLCTDNAAMVAYAGSLMLSRGYGQRRAARSLSVDPSMAIRSWR